MEKKMQSLFAFRYIITQELGSGEDEKFVEWAIGPNYGSRTFSEWPALWNSLHGKEFMILDNSKILDDIIKMIELYKNRHVLIKRRTKCKCKKKK